MVNTVHERELGCPFTNLNKNGTWKEREQSERERKVKSEQEQSEWELEIHELAHAWRNVNKWKAYSAYNFTYQFSSIDASAPNIYTLCLYIW